MTTDPLAAPVPLDILAAARRLRGLVYRTPLAPVSPPGATEPDTGEIRLKLESLQPTGSFKLRGATNALLVLRQKSGAVLVVTASAGNHGRAIAHAAASLGMPATVFAPRQAPVTKLDGIRSLGAELRLTESYEQSELDAKRFSIETGAVFISPYSDPDVIAGAGTIGLEILEDMPSVTQIVMPVGGGGLVSGVAIAAKSIDPSIRIVGVEAEASHPFHSGIAAGRLVEIEVKPTLADGLAGNPDPETITFDIVRRLVDDLVRVDEDEISAAMRSLVREHHLIAEGAGAVGLAAVLSGKVKTAGHRTVVIVSGGNIDVAKLKTVLD